MTATIGQLKQMLASLGGLMVRERLAAGETPQEPPKGNQKPGGIGKPMSPGIPSDTWKGHRPKRVGRGSGGGGAAIVVAGGGLLLAAYLMKKGRRR